MYSKRHRCDYGSEFSGSESEAEHAKKAKYDLSLMGSAHPPKMGLFLSSGRSNAHKIPSKGTFSAELDKQEGRRMRHHGILAMNAFARHQKFVNDYLTYYGGRREDFKQAPANPITEKEIIQQNNKFLWDDDEGGNLSWEKRLALKYWKKLYKEYTIADLSRFKDNKVALRWRIEKEVLSGKGQFICGNKKCEEQEGLRSWEVNFGYIENREKKNALVKLRLCPECSYMLNYHKKKREIKRRKQKSSTKEKRSDAVSDTAGSTSTPSSSSPKERNPTPISKDKDDQQDKWTRPPVQEDITREDEFDKYFDDLFL